MSSQSAVAGPIETMLQHSSHLYNNAQVSNEAACWCNKLECEVTCCTDTRARRCDSRKSEASSPPGPTSAITAASLAADCRGAEAISWGSCEVWTREEQPAVNVGRLLEGSAPAGRSSVHITFIGTRQT